MLTMLGVYLYTLVIICNMLSILNKLTLQKELQNFVSNIVFWTKLKTQQNKNKTSKINTCAGAGTNTSTSRT